MDLRGERRTQFDKGHTSIKEARVVRARDLFVGFQSNTETGVAERGVSFSFGRGETLGREEAIA
jgi:hypothetical protein